MPSIPGIRIPRRSSRVQIRLYLIAEAAEGRIPTAQDVANQFGVARTYVHRIRSELVAAGALPQSPRGRYIDKDPGTKLSIDLDRAVRNATIKSLSEATAPLTAAMADEASKIHKSFDLLDLNARAMTTDERRIFYSELARKTHRQEIKVSALAALDRLEARVRSDDHVGPPDPLTETEANERIAELERARADLAARIRTPALG